MQENLETWFLDQPTDSFPNYDPAQGRKSCQEQYKEIREKLLPIHNNVEKGAMLEAIVSWKKDITSRINAIKNNPEEIERLSILLNQDPAIYLNQHGVGHVEKVIEKVSEIIANFKNSYDRPTPFETFLLLCSIQVHDIGNIFGRKKHEQSFQSIFTSIAKSVIPDSITQKVICRIARVHSGNIDDNKDTISAIQSLSDNTILSNQEIRSHLLASLLRLGDELADDSSRADMVALNLDIIPEESKIYHKYSQTLHTVKISKNEVNKTLYLFLVYCVDGIDVKRKFIKNNKKTLLIDEIFQRTIKMERERRYCMRFLGQYLPLLEIRVEIEIVSDYDLIIPEKIKYILKDESYSSDKHIRIDCPNNTGKKVLDCLKQKGWKL